MTEYLDHCQALCLPTYFHHGAIFYILEKFCSNPNLSIDFDEFVNENGENVLQVLFDKSPVNFRLYGSAKELAENLKIFMGFPASHLYFCANYAPYVMTPILYENLKNEKFICKLDLFPVLQSMLARSFPHGPMMVVMLIVIPILKFEEKRLKGLPEFVRFDQKVFDEIWKEIQKAQKQIEAFHSAALLFSDFINAVISSVTDLFKSLQNFVPNNWDDGDVSRISAWFGSFVHDLRHENEPDTSRIIASIFVQAQTLCETLQSVIDARPEMFRLYDETKKGPVTVRMFEDAGHRFVMKMELFNALRASSEGAIQIDYTDFNHKYDTMRMEDVLKEYEDQIKGIEFIRYPIKRAKHRAVPVNGPDPAKPDQHSILVVDILFEVFRSLFFECQLFQDNQEEFAWPTFTDDMKAFFKETACPYFLRKVYHGFIVSQIQTFWGTVEDDKKNVRNTKPDGFTVQDLKNELAHLNLTVAFPEIQNYAEAVYEHVDRVKKERFLRTCDLYDAIEQCQLICIFERIPNLKKFLHNQGGCGRVIGVMCHLCMDQQKTSKNQEHLKLRESDTTLSCTSAIVSLSEHSEVENLKNELEKEKEKSARLEQELLKLTAENEKSMNKLSIETSSKSSVTVVDKPITCIICQGEIEKQMTIDCPLCGTKFHKKCALQYGQHQKKCPACKGEIVKFIF